MSIHSTFSWSAQHNTDTQVCLVCPHHCTLKPHQFGLCRVRVHDGTQIVPVVQQGVIFAGQSTIERHSLYHYYPNSKTLVVGSIGCSASCDYCQNWEVALAPKIIKQWTSPQTIYSLDELQARIKRESIHIIVLSINEFSVWPEGIDTIVSFAKQHGVLCVLVTNGFVSPQWSTRFIHHFDAVKIDLKVFDDTPSKKIGIWQQPIVDYLNKLRNEDIWVELSLVVESGINGNTMMHNLVRLAHQLTIFDIPIHLQRFLPSHKLVGDVPPSVSEMQQHRRYLLDHGFAHVYLSNIAGLNENHSYCPKCGYMMISRSIKSTNVQVLQCQTCGYVLPGRFDMQGLYL
jgi:pyruvate formate lyase activating enzyme